MWRFLEMPLRFSVLRFYREYDSDVCRTADKRYAIQSRKILISNEAAYWFVAIRADLVRHRALRRLP